MRAEVGFRSCFLSDIGQVVVICTEYVLDRGSPGRALSRSPPGKNKMDRGQIQGRSRGQGSRNSNSSLFWRERQTDRSEGFCILGTDRAQICPSPVGRTLCLTSSLPSSLSPGLRDFLRAGGPSYEKVELVKLTFCSPSSSLGSSEPLRAPPPFALGPSWVGGK